MEDEGDDKVESEHQSKVSQKVLFVRNLPFSTTDQDLENLFSEIGPIKRCFVIRDKGKELYNQIARGHAIIACPLALVGVSRDFLIFSCRIL